MVPEKLFEVGPTPLAPFVDGASRRSRFSVRPASRPCCRSSRGCWPGGRGRHHTAAGHAEGRLLGQRARRRRVPHAAPGTGHHLRAGRSSIALVQFDLLAGSSVLQHLVARTRSRHDTDVPLAGAVDRRHPHPRRARPVPAAPTSTTGSPRTGRGSTRRTRTSWSSQIAGAVSTRTTPAAGRQVATGSTEVWGLTRNRSLDPHVQNGTVSDKRLDPQRKWVSVNPASTSCESTASSGMTPVDGERATSRWPLR